MESVIKLGLRLVFSTARFIAFVIYFGYLNLVSYYNLLTYAAVQASTPLPF